MNHADDLYEPALVSVSNVSVAFDSAKILRDIDIDIPAGQTLALIGESGCGKTVLLKTIMGLIKPTTGTVHYDEKNLHAQSERSMVEIRRRFGFVFQNAALFDSMTIGQNVAFPLRQHKQCTPKEIQERVLDRLAEVGLPDTVVYKKPAELSGGMRKRVGLARALILDPEVILYDEPTTGLDPIMSDVINELIVRTRRRYPVTSVVVTHDMHTARKVADRVIMLYPLARLGDDDEQKIYDGAPGGLDQTRDRRVRQFVNGEAGERLMELRQEQTMS